jgi:hypothetical protein
MANKPPLSRKKFNANKKRKAAVVAAPISRQASNESNWINDLSISTKILGSIGVSGR